MVRFEVITRPQDSTLIIKVRTTGAREEQEVYNMLAERGITPIKTWSEAPYIMVKVKKTAAVRDIVTAGHYESWGHGTEAPPTKPPTTPEEKYGDVTEVTKWVYKHPKTGAVTMWSEKPANWNQLVGEKKKVTMDVPVDSTSTARSAAAKKFAFEGATSYIYKVKTPEGTVNVQMGVESQTGTSLTVGHVKSTFEAAPGKPRAPTTIVSDPLGGVGYRKPPKEYWGMTTKEYGTVSPTGEIISGPSPVGAGMKRETRYVYRDVKGTIIQSTRKPAGWGTLGGKVVTVDVPVGISRKDLSKTIVKEYKTPGVTAAVSKPVTVFGAPPKPTPTKATPKPLHSLLVKKDVVKPTVGPFVPTKTVTKTTPEKIFKPTVFGIPSVKAKEVDRKEIETITFAPAPGEKPITVSVKPREYTPKEKVFMTKIKPSQLYISTPKPGPKPETKEEIIQRGRAAYQRATPLEKVGLRAHTLLSPSGAQFIGAHMPGAEVKPEEVMYERIGMAARVKKEEELGYIMTSAVYNPVVEAETALLLPMGIGKVATTTAGAGLLAAGEKTMVGGFTVSKAVGYGLGSLYAVGRGTEITTHLAAGEISKAWGATIMTATEVPLFVVGGRIYKKYTAGKQLKETVAEAPPTKRAQYEATMKEITRLEKGKTPEPRRITIETKRIPERGKEPFLRHVRERGDVIGGSQAQRLFIEKPSKARYIEADVDVYTKAPPAERAREVARILRKAGVERVSTVKGKVTIRGKKAIEYHPYEQLAFNIEQVSPYLRPVRAAITKEPSGVRVLRIGTQVRRKAVGALDPYRYSKDAPDARQILKSLRKTTEIKPSRRMKGTFGFQPEEVPKTPRGAPPTRKLETYPYKGYGKYPKVPPMYPTYPYKPTVRPSFYGPTREPTYEPSYRPPSRPSGIFEPTYYGPPSKVPSGPTFYGKPMGGFDFKPPTGPAYIPPSKPSKPPVAPSFYKPPKKPTYGPPPIIPPYGPPSKPPYKPAPPTYPPIGPPSKPPYKPPAGPPYVPPSKPPKYPPLEPPGKPPYYPPIKTPPMYPPSIPPYYPPYTPPTQYPAKKPLGMPPFILLPGEDIFKRKVVSKKPPTRLPIKYAPSLAGVVFKDYIKKAPKKMMTGFEVRPALELKKQYRSLKM